MPGVLLSKTRIATFSDLLDWDLDSNTSPLETSKDLAAKDVCDEDFTAVAVVNNATTTTTTTSSAPTTTLKQRVVGGDNLAVDNSSSDDVSSSTPKEEHLPPASLKQSTLNITVRKIVLERDPKWMRKSPTLKQTKLDGYFHPKPL